MIHREFLANAVLGPEELQAALAQAGPLQYDCEKDLVTLEPAHICSVLRRYVAGELAPESVEFWADFLELRPGISYGSEEAEALVSAVSDALYELSTPDINGPLTPARALEIIDQLAAST